jgi:phosphate transport system substrate-binding protein
VHAGNPLSSLTLTQLREVFSGRTWRWSELGAQASEQEIVVVTRETGSGTRAAFERQVLRSSPAQDAAMTTMAVLRLSSARMVAYVAEHPAAVGYVALGALDAAPDRAQVKVLAIEGVAPGPAQVAAGDYPLSLPIHLVAPAEPTGAARRFLDFCLGPQGQRLVAERYVPVRD